MTRHDIAKLACKILALWFFCKVIESIFTVVMLFASLIPRFNGSQDWEGFIPSLAVLGTVACPGALGLVLWHFAGPIASLMVKPDDQPVTSRHLDARMILNILLAAIGAFFAADALLRLGRFFFVVTRDNASMGEFWKDSQLAPTFWTEIAKLAIAIWLMFGARGLAKMIMKYRSPRRQEKKQAAEPMDSQP